MTDPSQQASGGFHLSPRLITIAVIAVVALVFILQNTDSARLKIIFFTVEMPTWIAFLALLLIGAAIGYFGRGARDKRRAL